MANPATVEDLEKLWRPFTIEEKVVAQAWLDAAWVRLTELDSTLEARMAAGNPSQAAVESVVCAAVLRVLQNPEGKRQGSLTIDDATRSWTLDEIRASGLLQFTDDELSLIGISAQHGPFSIKPAGDPGFAVWPDVWPSDV